MNPTSDKAVALVVDDDATTRLLTVEALENVGLEVVEAPDGPSALAIFERQPPDLVLLDVMMPGINGFAVCRRIREDRRGAHIPIIMLTGLEGSESVELAYEAGATDFIPKPINWTLLVHRVRYVLRSAATRAALAVSEERLLQAQRVAQMGSWNWVAEGDQLTHSRNYPGLFGIRGESIGERLVAPLAHIHPSDREILADALALLREGHPYQIDFRTVWPDGAVHTLRDTAVPEVDDRGMVSGAHGTLQDVTEQVEAERRIRYLAYFDPLTGLPNRGAFREALEATLIRVLQAHEGLGVILLDLNRFGLLNDSLGREAADQVLQLIAGRVREFARSELGGGDVADDTELAIAARYGPDQFAVMVRDADFSLRERLFQAASRLQEAIAAPMQILRHSLAMKGSVGIAALPDHAEDADSLLKSAETALRQAKRDPSGHMVLEYSTTMRESSIRRLRLESALRMGLDLNIGLSMHYQPKVDLAERRVIGAEALLRWNDPVQGQISPADFVPIAEDIGLIVPLSEWVIDAVCRQVADWRDQGLPRLPVAINLSAAHFRFAGLLDTIIGTLARYGLDGRDIEFELTESALMGDPVLAGQILDTLHERGVRVAVDDFGTGYSSLAYLKRFRLTTLKIDRSFVRDIGSDRSDAAIVSAIVAMARMLDLGLVAEGVETDAQARHVMDLGCTVVQGYLFAAAMPAAAYAEVLTRGLPSLAPPGQ